MRWGLAGILLIAATLINVRSFRSFLGPSAPAGGAVLKSSPSRADINIPSVRLTESVSTEKPTLNIADLEKAAETLAAKGNAPEARRILKQILLKQPDNSFALLGLTTLVSGDEQVQETTRWLTHLLKVKPESGEITRNAAEFFLNQGNEARAFLLLQQLSGVPEHALYAHSELGRLYEKSGRLLEAAQQTRLAIAQLEGSDHSPDHGRELGSRQLLLAHLLLKLGQPVEAEHFASLARKQLKEESDFEMWEALSHVGE